MCGWTAALSSLHALPAYNHNEQLKLQGSLHAVPGYMCGLTATLSSLHALPAYNHNEKLKLQGSPPRGGGGGYSLIRA